MKKCIHKSKPLVEMPICKKKKKKKKKNAQRKSKINILKNKSKIIEIPVNDRYVNQKCKNSYVMVRHLPIICSAIAFR